MRFCTAVKVESADCPDTTWLSMTTYVESHLDAGEILDKDNIHMCNSVLNKLPSYSLQKKIIDIPLYVAPCCRMNSDGTNGSVGKSSLFTNSASEGYIIMVK